jgi:hypothetical protein
VRAQRGSERVRTEVGVEEDDVATEQGWPEYRLDETSPVAAQDSHRVARSDAAIAEHLRESFGL